MADKTLPDIPPADALTGAELLLLVQDGNSRSLVLALLMPYILGELGSAAALDIDPDGALAANSDLRLATQKAVRTAIDAAINGLINSAPGTLDTLGEIATALAADEGALAALTATVAGKLAKAANLSDLADVPTARGNLGANRRQAVLQIVGTPLGASEVLGTIAPPANEVWTIAANFAGSQGKKKSDGVNPAAAYAITVRKNGAAAGSITISPAGVVAFATTGAEAIVLDGAAGDCCDFVGSAVADAAVGYVFAIALTFT